jgi:hypothetical protein
VQWIYGQIAGIPRWAIALVLITAYLAWQRYRGGHRAPAPPDGDFEAYPTPMKRYRTTRAPGRRAA